MKRFIEGENRFQSTLFPESLEDYIAADNPVRVIDAFVDGLDLKQLGFDRAEPSETGRPRVTIIILSSVVSEAIHEINPVVAPLFHSKNSNTICHNNC